MAPPQRWPPELNEDITVEILLRIPPDEPAHLIRASVVCKLWLHVVSDPAFLSRYSAFHRGAPLLGFFYNLDSAWFFPGFVPTTAASPPPQPGHSDWVRWVPDCRHGRVLLKGIGSLCKCILMRGIGSRTFLVWDPFSNHWEEVEAPSSLSTTFQSNAVVLCALPGCDHSSCRGGPFHVVFVGADKFDYTIVHAHVYSSESRSWCTTASAQLDGTRNFFDKKRAVLIRDGIYCTVNDGARILKYDLVEHHLSLIGMPYLYKNVPVLMQNEDGSLGIAGVLDSRLYLWSTVVNLEGVTGWVQRRVIELKEILPVDVISDQANLIGFAEGVEVFFISTNVGAFTFELKSRRVTKVGKPRDYHCATPFISFFRPGMVSAIFFL
jgi:hypothetical protein